jgi:hypothetical protein
VLVADKAREEAQNQLSSSTRTQDATSREPKSSRSNDRLARCIAVNPYYVVRRPIAAKNNNHVPSS